MSQRPEDKLMLVEVYIVVFLINILPVLMPFLLLLLSEKPSLIDSRVPAILKQVYQQNGVRGLFRG
jgi:hypothetical protein